MDRVQAGAEYRRILAGVVRHYQALDRHVSGAATAPAARRLGLGVRGGVIEAGDDAMVLVSNVAVYGRVAGSSRAIDRYAGAAPGSLDAFDRELLEALRHGWFSVLRLTARHPVAGWDADDFLLGRTWLWLMNEALEQSARAGGGLATRLFEFGGFVLSTGAGASLTDTVLAGLHDNLSAANKGGFKCEQARDPLHCRPLLIRQSSQSKSHRPAPRQIGMILQQR